MPSARRNRFRGRPQTSRRVSRRTPIEGPDGGTQTETVTTTNRRVQSRTERRTPISTGGTQTEVITSDTGEPRQRKRTGIPSPVAAGKSAGGVGLLEAEFLGSILLLVLLLFADMNKSYADKIMSTMKRGTFIALLFFILALMAGVGPNAAKIAKAIGALVFISIVLTAPVTDTIGTLDKFFKADWTGTTEQGTDTSSGSNQSSTSSGSNPASRAGNAASNVVQGITKIIESFGFGLIK